MLDTWAGRLSYILNGVNLGEAFVSDKLWGSDIYAYVSIFFPNDSVKFLVFK